MLNAAKLHYLPRDVTWSVVLGAFEPVKLVPRVQEVRRIAALNTVQAAQEEQMKSHRLTMTHKKE